MADTMFGALPQQRLQIVGVVAHQHCHDMDLSAAVRGRLAQQIDGAPGALGRPGQAAVAVVALGVGVVDRYADLGQPGREQVARRLLVDEPAVGVQHRQVSGAEGADDFDDVGADERLAAFQ